jgi:hypothetical protein
METGAGLTRMELGRSDGGAGGLGFEEVIWRGDG